MTGPKSANSGSRQAVGGSLQGSGVVQRLKRRAFGVVYALSEKRTHHRVTNAESLLAVLLYTYQSFEIALLLCRTELGWDEASVLWLRDISLKGLLFDGKLLNTKVGTHIGAMALAIVVVALSVRVDSMVQHNNFRRPWPLSVLRILARFLTTALFVPFVDALLIPFSCDVMDCSTDLIWLQQLGGVCCLVAVVPLLALYSMLMHESDPNAANIDSKNSGWELFFLNVLCLLTIVTSVAGQGLLAILLLLAIVAYGYYATFILLRLPFFHRVMNHMRVTLAMGALYLVMGAFIATIGVVGDNTTFTVVWLITSVPVAVGSAFLPTWRYRGLLRRLLSMRDRMVTDLNRKRRNVSKRWFNTPNTPAGSGSVRDVRAAHISKLAQAARDIRYRTAALPLGAAEDDAIFKDDVDESGGSKTVFEGMRAYEAELIVRAELALPGNTDNRKRRRRFGRSTGPVPTTEAVENVVWLFSEAMNEFTEDAVDIATVKIEQARYLQVYTADVNMATSALEAAQRERPSLEGQYEVFSRMQRLQAKRQAQNVGGDRDLNEVVLVEYSKRVNLAMRHHMTALDRMSRLLKVVSSQHQMLRHAGDAMAEKLGKYLEGMATARQAAHDQYVRLLHSHTNAPYLSEVFARFASDVMADPELASQYNANVAEGSDAASESSKGSRGSGGTNGTSKSQGKSMRKFVPKRATVEVKVMDMRFRWGILMLLLIAASVYTATHVVVMQANERVNSLNRAGLVRFFTVEAAMASRTASLLHGAGQLGDFTNSTVASMGTFKNILTEVYMQAHHEPAEHWDSRDVEVRVYSSGEEWYTRKTSFWELANLVAADAATFDPAAAAGYHDDKSWRFVMDNAMTVLLPGLEGLLEKLQAQIFDAVIAFDFAVIGLMVVLLITLSVLGCCVFGRALRRVDVIKRRVNEIGASLPPLQIAKMRTRVRNGQAQLRQLRQKIAAALSEQEDRGMGDVDDFTYDEDEEKKSISGAHSPQPYAFTDMPPLSPVAGPADVLSRGKEESGLDLQPDVVHTSERARHGFMRGDTADTAGTDDSAAASVSFAVTEAGVGRVVTIPQLQALDTLESQLSQHSDGGAVPEAGPLKSSPLKSHGTVAGSVLHVPSGISPSSRLSAGEPPLQVQLHSDTDSAGVEQASKANAERQHHVEEAEEKAVIEPALTLDEAVLSSHNASMRREGSVSSSLGAANSDDDDDEDNAGLAQEDEKEDEKEDVPDTCPVSGRKASAQSTCPIAHTIVINRRRGSGTPTSTAAAPKRTAMKHKVRKRTGSVTKRSALKKKGRKRAGSTTKGVGFQEAAGKEVEKAVDMPSIEDIVNTSPGCVVATDSIGTVKYINTAFTKILGYTKKEFIGRNVSVLTPPGIRERHIEIMTRVVDGGTPRVIGRAGRQLNAVHKDGSSVPILLALNRFEVDGEVHFVANISDLSHQMKAADGQEDEETNEVQGGSTQCGIVLRVALALIMVFALQLGVTVLSIASITSVSEHAAEINSAGKLRFITHALAFACREAVIGDDELWTSLEATDQIQARLVTYDRVRFGLRFGDDELRLPGSSGRDPEQDKLQFGRVNVDGTVFEGLDAFIASYDRAARLCAVNFAGGSRHTGPSYTAVQAVPEWTELQEATYGELGTMLGRSVQLYQAEVDAQVQSVLRTSVVVSALSAGLVIALYIVVFRRMVVTLLAQATRTEDFLAALPEEVAQSGPLVKYYARRE